MTFPGSIQTAIGAPGNMRIGRITAIEGGVVSVTLENTVLDVDAVGFLDTYVPSVDDVVAISGQSAQPSARSASWLVHGKIVGSANVSLAHASYNADAGTLFTVSPAFVNFGAAAVSFTKARDDTSLLIWLNLSFFTDQVLTAAEFAVEFTPGPTAVVMTHFFHNPAGQHQSCGGTNVLLNVPAGAVTAQVQWRRTAGGGQLITDNNDNVSLLVLESSTV